MMVKDVLDWISILEDKDYINYSRIERLMHLNAVYKDIQWEMDSLRGIKFTKDENDLGTTEIDIVAGNTTYSKELNHTIKRLDIDGVTWKEVDDTEISEGCSCEKLECECKGRYTIRDDKIIFLDKLDGKTKIKLWTQKDGDILNSDNDIIRLEKVSPKYLALKCIQIYLSSTGNELSRTAFFLLQEEERKHKANNIIRTPIPVTNKKDNVRFSKLK